MNDLSQLIKKVRTKTIEKEFENSYLNILHKIWQLQKEVKKIDHLAEELQIHIIKEKESLHSDKRKEVCCSSKLLDCERCYQYYRGVCNTESNYEEYPINTKTSHTIESD